MTKIIVLAIFMVAGLNSYAQNSCGVYSSIKDYKENEISVLADGSARKHALCISDVLSRPYIYLKKGSGRLKISMDSVYAVRCSSGNVFRIWKRNAFKLEENDVLQIYSLVGNQRIKCRTSRGGRFKTQKVTRYYFSISDSAVIYPLNSANIGLSLQLPRAVEQKLAEAFPDEKAMAAKQNNHFIINDFIKTIQ